MQLNEPTESYFLMLSMTRQHVIRNFNVVASNRKIMNRISVKKTNKILREKFPGWECVCYLEAVLDVVARLPDAHSLQHTCVAQLPQHQVVIKPQGQLRDRDSATGEEIIRNGKRPTHSEKIKLQRKWQKCFHEPSPNSKSCAERRYYTFSALERIHLTK